MCEAGAMHDEAQLWVVKSKKQKLEKGYLNRLDSMESTDPVWTIFHILSAGVVV